MQSIFLSASSSWYRRVTGRSGLTISFAKVCRPSYRSHAAAHSTPGNVMDWVSRPEPCMPIPIIPKRSRSLAGTGRGEARSGSAVSRIALPATDAPAAAALIPRNLRREYVLFFIKDLLALGTLFVQFFQGNFLEENNVVVAVILQAKIAFEGPWPTLWFKIKFPIWYRIAFGIVRNFHSVENHDAVRTVQSYLHRVPLRSRLAGLSEGLRQSIARAGDVVVVLVRGFGMIVNLHIIPVLDADPLLAGFHRNPSDH